MSTPAPAEATQTAQAPLAPARGRRADVSTPAPAPARMAALDAVQGESAADYFKRLGRALAKHAPAAMEQHAQALARLAAMPQGAPWKDAHEAMRALAMALLDAAPQAIADAYAKPARALFLWGEVYQPYMRLLACRLADIDMATKRNALGAAAPCKSRATRQGDIGRFMANAAAAPLPVTFERYGEHAGQEYRLEPWHALALNYFDVIAAAVANKAFENACFPQYGITLCSTLQTFTALHELIQGALYEYLEWIRPAEQDAARADKRAAKRKGGKA